MSSNLAQRIGQEFKALRDIELSLKADTSTVNDALALKVDSTTLGSMFEMLNGEIVFKGNLVPSQNEVFSIGSATHKIKDLFVSANTIYLGSATTIEGTSITVDAGTNPTTLNDTPTVMASTIIAKPFKYNPGTGNIIVRPTIGFQDAQGNTYPISFDTVNNKFSFDALGNHGQGSVVAKNLEISGTLAIGSGGAITIAGYTFGSTQFKIDNNLRVDGNVTLGYDLSSVVTLRGTTAVEAPITFKEGATLGDGNDSITINSGLANNFLITAKNVSLDANGTLTGAKITEAQITDLKSYVTTTSVQALKTSGALTKVGNVMYLNKADGTSETIDLSMYLDDTNLARIISGTYNATTKSLVFTRDDNSTFSVDTSMFFDDTNLVTSVAGRTGAITLSASDVSGFATVATTGSYTDLSNKPTIGAGTITVRGTGVLGGTGSFDLNATSNNTIDITHDDVTRTDTTSNVAPAAGATFTAVDGVSTSTDGHVTAINVKTITLPGAYALPSATSTVLGGIKLGSDTVQTVAANAVTATASRTYAVQANASGQLMVNVPWVDTDVNNYTTSVSFNTGTGILNVSRNGLTDVTVDLNGRYIENPASGKAGDILYHNGTSYVRLPKGADGQILTLVNGLPAWKDRAIG